MKEQSFEWMLQGCHSITEIAVAYFPNYQYDCSAVNALRRAIKEHASLLAELTEAGFTQNHYTDSETDISLSPAVGHAFTGEGIYRQKSILIRTQNSRKDIMYFNTFISILYIMWLKGWLKTFFNKF